MIGHNPKTKHEADDLQDITALLRELPRVSAPADFNASLKARLATARAEASEFASVTALVKDLPRVAAPADFDFKLRARIAQAKAEQQDSAVGAGWLAVLFGRSFSWAQAGVAIAAVALVVSVFTFNVLRSVDPVNTTVQTNVAQTTIPETPSAATTTTDANVAAAPTRPIPAPVRSFGTDVAIKSRTIRYTAPAPPHAVPAPSAAAPETAGLVATKVMIKHRSGEARMVNLSEYNLGLQTAQIRPTPAKANPNTVETAAVTNIY
ncbi:MAG TPA: hypothetical protein VFZ34_07985 [Blastocatellia bacterium]|nr:hypothetical protein [Blastocatellia bacterium]